MKTLIAALVTLTAMASAHAGPCSNRTQASISVSQFLHGTEEINMHLGQHLRSSSKVHVFMAFGAEDTCREIFVNKNTCNIWVGVEMRGDLQCGP